MTRDEAVAEIKQILGFRSSLTTEIEAALRFMQNELEHEPTLPYFLRTEVTSTVSIASNENLALPTGFLKPWDEDPLQVQDSDGNWNTLVRDSAAYLRSVYQADGEGIPVAYAWDGINSRKLFPTPDAVYTFRETYYKADTVLDSNITNLWLTHLPYTLIGRTGAKMAASLRDQNALQLFSSLVASEKDKLNSLTTEVDGRRYVIGGDD